MNLLVILLLVFLLCGGLGDDEDADLSDMNGGNVFGGGLGLVVRVVVVLLVMVRL